ncbi:hypothetical protein D3C81_1492980 [compost metagenome]
MAANQLAGNAVHHAIELETPLFPGQLAVVDHLEQQVAQLTLQVLEIAALDGVGDLVGFLDGVGNDTRVVLLQVPRAAVLRVAQTGHEVQQVFEGVGHVSRSFGGGFFAGKPAPTGSVHVSGFARTLWERVYPRSRRPGLKGYDYAASR